MTEKYQPLGIDQIFDIKTPLFEPLFPDRERERQCNLATGCLKRGIFFLKDWQTFPNRRINRLMLAFLSALNSRVVKVNLTDIYENLCLGFNEEEGREEVFVLVPWDFVSQCQRYPTDQLRLMVKTASFLQEYLSGNLNLRSEEAKSRCFAYQAEFLLTRRTIPPTFVANDGDRKILASFPEGLASLAPKLRPELPLVIWKEGTPAQ